MSAEQRQYPRISPNVRLNVMGKQIDKETRKYFEGIIGDISLGGMFIKTDQPFSKGSKVRIQFNSEKDNGDPITAIGLVRWTRKWMKPRGMGVDFIEFEGLGSRSFEDWMRNNFL